jgi:hypothetical protein
VREGEREREYVEETSSSLLFNKELVASLRRWRDRE